MGSNLSFAIRGIFSKKLMTSPVGENMDPANLFAVLTIMSFTLMLPFVVYWEGGEIEERLEVEEVAFLRSQVRLCIFSILGPSLPRSR